MRVLLLGVGMQGKAALHDLLGWERLTGIVAADRDLEGLRAHVGGLAAGASCAGVPPVDGSRATSLVRCEPVDGGDPASLARLFAEKPDIAIDLMPPHFTGVVARAAIDQGVSLVNTSYVRPEVRALAAEAERRGVAILPECGMDPGIDLVLTREAVRRLDRVTSLRCYGGGIPDPAAAVEPLRYKITWTFEGVLRAYRRPARLIRGGRRIEIAPGGIFAREQVHALEIEGLGELEAIPNGDALQYVEPLGLDPQELREMGRFTLRYPGHSALWKTLGELGLLDDDPVLVDGMSVDRRRYLAALLEPRLRYEAGERDLAILRVEAEGLRAGRPERVVLQVIDRRDLATGLTAMSRTVGFSASIGAQLLATGVIPRRGLLSPLTDLPYDRFVEELARRGIRVTEG